MSGTCSSSHLGAAVFAPISPTARREPARAAVGDARGRARASRAAAARRAPASPVIASPICTARGVDRSRDSSCSSTDENVAPWIPSRPVRPPTTTIGSPGLHVLVRRSRAGSGPTVPAVHERIADVAARRTNAAVDRRDAHAVAVVAHARRPRRAGCAAGAAQPFGTSRRPARSGGPTKNASVLAIGLRAEADAEDVADHAADARARAAVGLDRATGGCASRP